MIDSTLTRTLCIGVLLLACCGGCSKGEKAASDDREVRMADMKRQVDEADRLWASGEKQKAVEIYSATMNTPDGLYYLDAERRDLSTVASRVIDFKITNSGPESARSEIELAARMWAKITVSSSDGQEFVEQVTQSYRQRNDDASASIESSRGEKPSRADTRNAYEAREDIRRNAQNAKDAHRRIVEEGR